MTEGGRFPPIGSATGKRQADGPGSLSMRNPSSSLGLVGVTPERPPRRPRGMSTPPQPVGGIVISSAAHRGHTRGSREKQLRIAEESVRRSHAVDVYLQRKAAAASLTLLKDDLKTVTSVAIATTLPILDKFDERPDPHRVESDIAHLEWRVESLRREYDDTQRALGDRAAVLSRLVDTHDGVERDRALGATLAVRLEPGIAPVGSSLAAAQAAQAAAGHGMAAPADTIAALRGVSSPQASTAKRGSRGGSRGTSLIAGSGGADPGGVDTTDLGGLTAEASRLSGAGMSHHGHGRVGPAGGDDDPDDPDRAAAPSLHALHIDHSGATGYGDPEAPLPSLREDSDGLWYYLAEDGITRIDADAARLAAHANELRRRIRVYTWREASAWTDVRVNAHVRDRVQADTAPLPPACGDARRAITMAETELERLQVEERAASVERDVVVLNVSAFKRSLADTRRGHSLQLDERRRLLDLMRGFRKVDAQRQQRRTHIAAAAAAAADAAHEKELLKEAAERVRLDEEEARVLAGSSSALVLGFGRIWEKTGCDAADVSSKLCHPEGPTSEMTAAVAAARARLEEVTKLSRSVEEALVTVRFGAEAATGRKATERAVESLATAVDRCRAAGERSRQKSYLAAGVLLSVEALGASLSLRFKRWPRLEDGRTSTTPAVGVVYPGDAGGAEGGDGAADAPPGAGDDAATYAELYGRSHLLDLVTKIQARLVVMLTACGVRLVDTPPEGDGGSSALRSGPPTYRRSPTVVSTAPARPPHPSALVPHSTADVRAAAATAEAHVHPRGPAPVACDLSLLWGRPGDAEDAAQSADDDALAAQSAAEALELTAAGLPNVYAEVDDDDGAVITREILKFEGKGLTPRAAYARSKAREEAKSRATRRPTSLGGGGTTSGSGHGGSSAMNRAPPPALRLPDMPPPPSLVALRTMAKPVVRGDRL